MSLSIAIVGLPNKDKDTLLIYMIKLASNVSLRITLRSFKMTIIGPQRTLAKCW